MSLAAAARSADALVIRQAHALLPLKLKSICSAERAIPFAAVRFAVGYLSPADAEFSADFRLTIPFISVS